MSFKWKFDDFLYTLTGATRKQKEKKVFSFKVYTKVECYEKKIWDLVFGIMYLVLVYPMTRSFISKISPLSHKSPSPFQNISLQFQWNPRIIIIALPFCSLFPGQFSVGLVQMWFALYLQMHQKRIFAMQGNLGFLLRM